MLHFHQLIAIPPRGYTVGERTREQQFYNIPLRRNLLSADGSVRRSIELLFLDY